MPNYDGTGPAGSGNRRGRKMGNCANEDLRNQPGGAGNRGAGTGRGRGGGRGMGRSDGGGRGTGRGGGGGRRSGNRA